MRTLQEILFSEAISHSLYNTGKCQNLSHCSTSDLKLMSGCASRETLLSSLKVFGAQLAWAICNTCKVCVECAKLMCASRGKLDWKKRVSDFAFKT